MDLLLSAARVLRASFLLGPIGDPLALSALEEEIVKCPQGASEERVSALSLLSWIPPYAHDMQRSKASSAEALQLARQLGVLQARSYVCLRVSHWSKRAPSMDSDAARSDGSLRFMRCWS